MPITGIGVRGLRSFGYSQQKTPLTKLNLYLGKNSCGKSTLLRTFPLIRQSVASGARYPILWYAGSSSLVDFGNHQTALHDGGDKIHFDFEIDFSPASKYSHLFARGIDYSTDLHAILSTNRLCQVTITLQIIDDVLKTEVKIQSGNNFLHIHYIGEEVQSLWVSNSAIDIEFQYHGKLYIQKGALIAKRAYKIEKKKPWEEIFGFTGLDVLPDAAVNFFSPLLKKYHHSSKSEQNISNEIRKLPPLPTALIEKTIQEIFSSDKHFIKNFESNKNEIIELTSLFLMAMYANLFLEAIDDEFLRYFEGVRYLGPVRASAERFYRHQDLQIDEVDHTGANLPMVLNSLTPHERDELSKWTKENFEFDIALDKSGHHYELRIKELNEEKFHNVSDMGFGYSQILPVIISIWLELNKSEESLKSRIIVIEQPELHLHPALQYKFGRMLAKIIKISKNKFYFVIETHSKHLIDSIGECIAEKTITNTDVNITLFERNSNGVTTTCSSGYDKEGYLTNWPSGFLAP